MLEGWSRSDLYVKDLKTEGSPFVPVAEKIDALFQGQVIDGTLYLLTNWEAPRYRLFAVDPMKPGRAAWKPLIPQTDAVSQGDVVLTSGLGEMYPEGYVVGKVARVERKDADPFQAAVVEPAVAMDKLERLYVLTDTGK